MSAPHPEPHAEPHADGPNDEHDGDVLDLVDHARFDRAEALTESDPSRGSSWRNLHDEPDEPDEDDEDGEWHGTPVWAEVEFYRRQMEQERAHEDALDLAEADTALGEVEIAPGIRVVRTSGTPEGQDIGQDISQDIGQEPRGSVAHDRFSDDEYDEYDALLDGGTRW